MKSGKITLSYAIDISDCTSTEVDLQREFDVMSKKSDQRTHRRRTAHIIAEYRVKEGVYRDIIRNIGTCGIFISTPRKIATDQQIEMRFPLFTFEHNILITGKVVRSGPAGFAVSFDRPIAGIINKNGKMTEIVHEIDRPANPSK